VIRLWLASVVVLVGGPFAHAGDPIPKRIASINLTADEVLVELAPERLVSVTQWADDPGNSNIVGRVAPGVFRFVKADMEQLVALRADLVVVSEYTDADFLQLISRTGMHHHRMQGLNDMAGVRQALLTLGNVVGTPQKAAALIERYDERLAELARRVEGVRRPRILYWSGGMTAGADTAIGALIETAGGANVGAELGIRGIAPPGAERAFAARPDAILIGTWPGSEREVREHPLLGRTEAVRSGRIIALPTRRLVTLSHHAADAAWELAALLHPDRFPPEE